jgi:NAD/NADP octopine/nopaline dehydrogenase, alpha-helical domain
MTTQITICGGGNAAHTLAALLSSQGDLLIHVYTPFNDEAEHWQESIRKTGGMRLSMPKGNIIGRPALICHDPGLAVMGSQIILLALPAFAHEQILREIAPHISSGAWVGALPARGGFDLCARDAFKERFSDVVIFGFQTLPWACRIQEYGKQVAILGTKEQVDLAAWPSELAPVISAQLQKFLVVRINPIANFLSLSLADTGQIIHPGIMYGLFHNWNGQPYPQPKLFYQGVDTNTAAVLQQLSDEVQTLRSTMEGYYPELNLSAVYPLREWLERSYRSDIADNSSLQSSFSTNHSYTGLLAPMHRIDGHFVPDFQARYLSEDVPYNLLVTRGIAELAGVATPMIDKVIMWAQKHLGKEYLKDGELHGLDYQSTRCPQRYGFTRLDQFMLELQYLSPGVEN